MKKLCTILLAFCTMSAASFHMVAQSVRTETISFKLDDVSELYMPPDLYMDLKFVDTDGDDALGAEEAGMIRVQIINKGGKADKVTVTVKPITYGSGISMKQTAFTTSVPKEGTKTLEFPMTASIDTPTGNPRFDITVDEGDGYGIEALMELSTIAFQKAALDVRGVTVVDAGKGLLTKGTPDGKIQKGEAVRVTVLLQNIGAGEAKNITYKVVSKDPNLHLLTESRVWELTGTVGDMLVEQTREISFRMSANNNYVGTGEYLPLYLTVTEDKGFGNIESRQIPISLNAVPMKPEVVKVQVDTEKLMASLGTKVYSENQKVTSDAMVKDIMLARHGEALYSDAVAIVIGAEKYQNSNIPRAPYASRDAQVMTEYFKTSMGIPEANITTLTDEMVTSRRLKELFLRDELKRKVIPGKTDVFIYYSGHGVPLSVDGRDEMYIIATDCNKEYIEEDGLSINTLYSNLEALEAKSVTVILDACFSGGSRRSGAYQSQNIAGHKLVMPDLSATERPWRYNPNFRVFASCKGDQTSLGYDRSLSGLFTYYLAVGLQGEADKSGDGAVTMRELADYVTENVDKVSKGDQTPQLFMQEGSDFVIEKIK